MTKEEKEEKKERERKDKNFKRLCQWFADAAEMAEILMEESPRIQNCYFIEKNEDNPDVRGINSALHMLEFLSPIAENPQDFECEVYEQRNDYPELAFGLMKLAEMVGQMCQNEDNPFV